MEEPDNKRHLGDVLDWIGHVRVVFSSDYPHWDFDDPRHALPPHIGPELTRAILHDNAAALYGATG
ncbi:MAG: amidohydrolase family protein, partial [Mesorhizobium sp.]|nr:amidohydrolase family protein [Mesorhizobium sp.]